MNFIVRLNVSFPSIFIILQVFKKSIWKFKDLRKVRRSDLKMSKIKSTYFQIT